MLQRWIGASVNRAVVVRVAARVAVRVAARRPPASGAVGEARRGVGSAQHTEVAQQADGRVRRAPRRVGSTPKRAAHPSGTRRQT